MCVHMCGWFKGGYVLYAISTHEYLTKVTIYRLIRENRYVQGYLNFVQAKCSPTGNVKVNKELGQTLY